MILMICGIVTLLILSALSSGSETAITGASREYVHERSDAGDKRAQSLDRLLDNREELIGALLICNNAVNILASALTAVLMEVWFGVYAAIATMVFLTPVVVVLSEVLPKTYAIRHADEVALSIAPTIEIVASVLRPLAQLLTGIVNMLLGLFGVDRTNTLKPGIERVRGTINYHARTGAMEKDERDMLGGVLDLNDVELSDIMTHRTKMVALNADRPLNELVELALGNPFTRLPVWRDDPDHIIGIMHVRDLLSMALSESERLETLRIEDIVSEPWFVPETTSARDQLLAFRQRQAHLSLVIDEYGTLLGLVTLEDILEEIVGEITDEQDIEVTGITEEAGSSAALVEGGVTIRDLNRHFDWRLPEEEAATIAGLVIDYAQHIPDVGKTFDIHGFRFEVLQRDGNRISLLRVLSLEDDTSAGVV